MYNKCLWQFQKCRCQRPCDTVLLFHLEVQICYFWMTVLKGKCCFPLTKPFETVVPEFLTGISLFDWVTFPVIPAVERSRVRCWPKFWGFWVIALLVCILCFSQSLLSQNTRTEGQMLSLLHVRSEARDINPHLNIPVKDKWKSWSHPEMSLFI